MSRSSPRAISRPRDLDLPADEASALHKLFESLTDAGRKEFIEELLDAVATAKKRDDLRPVQDVIESWYRTLLFVRRPGFQEAIARAERLDPDSTPPMTVEDIRRRLKV